MFLFLAKHMERKKSYQLNNAIQKATHRDGLKPVNEENIL